MTRAQGVAAIVSSDPSMRQRVAWYQEHMPPLSLFTDTPQSEWVAPYLEVAFEQGIVAGNPNRTFRPHDLLATEEALALVTRFKDRNKDQASVVLYLPGTNHTDDWYSVPLQAALTDGITVPSPLIASMPLERTDFYAMLSSAGINHPEDVSLVDPPLPPPVSVPIVLQPSSEHGSQSQPSGRIQLQPLRPGATYRRPSIQLPSRTVAMEAPNSGNSMPFNISLPTLGISHLTITHPADPFTAKGLLSVLQAGVGHLFSYPGKDGKILIYGHSSSYPWDVSSYTKIFRQINRLNAGDRVDVEYAGTTYVYEVTYKETVPAKDMSAYRNGGGEELILYTCWPPDSISERYLVHAKPVEKIAAR